MNSNNKQRKCDVVQLEISVEKLEMLFNKGLLCAVDLAPLNSESKTCIWNLCLSSCVKKLQCRVVMFDQSLAKLNAVKSEGEMHV